MLSGSKRCEGCRYWLQNPPPNEHLGDCRRTSPDVAGWPVTAASEWCGEYDSGGVVSGRNVNEFLKLLLGFVIVGWIILGSLFLAVYR